MKLDFTQNVYVGQFHNRKCKGSKYLPTATIRVKKAEKTLQDVSNSWAADGGECEENSTMFLIFSTTQRITIELTYSQIPNCNLCAMYHPAQGHDHDVSHCY